MTRHETNLRLPRLTLFVLLLTSQVFTGESNSDKKSKSLSQTTSSESSSPSYGYTFYHYRRPRYSQKLANSKSASTYNGHPHFSYGKMTAYHAAPALTTYDAGLGSYAPTYDSMGGYKDLEYEQHAKKEQNKHQSNNHDYEICPHKHDSAVKPENSELPAENQDGEHHGPSAEFKDENSQYDSSSHEDVDYKPHDEPKHEVSKQTYGKHQHSEYHAHGETANNGGHYEKYPAYEGEHYEKYPAYEGEHYENYPVYEGGRFVYTIHTDHGRPVYHKPVKQYSHEVHYYQQAKYPTETHSTYSKLKYPTETHSTYSKLKYPTETHSTYSKLKYPTENPSSYSKLKYQTNYQQVPYKPPKEEEEEKEEENNKHTSPKYPSEDHDEDKETKQQYTQPEYNKKTKHFSKYPSTDDHHEEKHEENYGSHYSTSHTSPHSSYAMQVHIPWTSFKCHNHYHPGFYADVQSHCTIWHYCQPDGRQDSFKCAKDTLFNQKSLTCDWWFNVDCPSSPHYYGNNQELYKLYGHPTHEVDMKNEHMILRSAFPSPSSKKKTKRPQIVIVTVKNKSKNKKKN